MAGPYHVGGDPAGSGALLTSRKMLQVVCTELTLHSGLSAPGPDPRRPARVWARRFAQIFGSRPGLLMHVRELQGVPDGCVWARRALGVCARESGDHSIGRAGRVRGTALRGPGRGARPRERGRWVRAGAGRVRGGKFRPRNDFPRRRGDGTPPRGGGTHGRGDGTHALGDRTHGSGSGTRADTRRRRSHGGPGDARGDAGRVRGDIASDPGGSCPEDLSNVRQWHDDCP